MTFSWRLSGSVQLRRVKQFRAVDTSECLGAFHNAAASCNA